jgi:hypothetical protein
MIDKGNLNYGALCSFEPTFMKQITDEDKTIQLTDNDLATYHLDMVDTKWSGVLLILVFLLMFGLVISLTTSVSSDLVFKLSGNKILHAVNRNT